MEVIAVQEQLNVREKYNDLNKTPIARARPD
jgi:hypothetical protein